MTTLVFWARVAVWAALTVVEVSFRRLADLIPGDVHDVHGDDDD